MNWREIHEEEEEEEKKKGHKNKHLQDKSNKTKGKQGQNKVNNDRKGNTPQSALPSKKQEITCTTKASQSQTRGKN